MKKRIPEILCIVLVFSLFAFMALGSGSASSDDSSEKPITNSSDESSTDKPSADSVTIDEQVLLDKDGLKITATGMTSDSVWGEGVKLLIENNTTQNLGVGCNALIVNDFMITDLFSSTVAAGKKANEVMYLSYSELQAAGISNVGKIEVYFYVFNSDTYSTIYNAEGVTIETSEIANMDTTVTDEGKELYNQNGIRIVGKYVDEDTFWGSAVLLYIENTSGQNVGINCDNMSINGFMVTPFLSSTVYAGKKAVDDITIMSSDLENNGIKSVNDIELSFNIYDVDSYQTISTSGPISFAVK